jgi:hypothetical protein
MLNEFSIERILRIFNANNVKMTLSNAFRVATIIFEAHSARVCEVEARSFDAGKLAGYDKGYAAGKIDSEEYSRGYNDGKATRSEEDGYTIERLEEIERKMMTIAAIAAVKIAKDHPQHKITAIKLLRTKSGLSLSQAKTLMDQAYRDIQN